ncbi:MAG: TonB-dependent receptor [Chitinophagaceae bacterium]|nr:TonB-dependent receptor [Chitinophagaceae bacterium]
MLILIHLKDYSQAFPTFKFAQYSAFFQDEYTVNKKLKLTFGLRADKSSYPGVEEIKDNKLVSGLTFADGKKYNTGKLPSDKILFSPRFGFNWDIYGDRSLQIRGGTGIFTGRVPYVWIVGQAGNSGMLQITQSYNTQATTFGPFNPAVGFYRPVTPPAARSTMPSTVTVFDEKFKMPQTLKTRLAIDVKLPWGIVGTLEGIYNRDYRVIYSKNVNLVAPAPLNVAGYPDNRLIYPSANAAKYINKLASGGPGILVPSASGTTAFSMIVTSNEKRGHSGFLTMQFVKPFKKGFSAMIAYTKSLTNRLYDGIGDQPFNTWSLIQSYSGANNPYLSYADDNIPDRVIASISYRKEYLKHLATQISFFWEGGIQGRFTYSYSRDFNRDGTNADPIYIPNNASEITFQSQTVNGVVYTAQQQSDLFFAYIEQDKYLRAHKGQYAERNGAQIPWRNQFDLRVVQDLFTNIGKSKNTLQFSVDIFNFGNMLNPKWGELKTINASSILVPRNESSLVAGGTVKPEFWLATDRGQLITKTFRDNQTVSSTYYMQFGLRYLFN